MEEMFNNTMPTETPASKKCQREIRRRRSVSEHRHVNTVLIRNGVRKKDRSKKHHEEIERMEESKTSLRPNPVKRSSRPKKCSRGRKVERNETGDDPEAERERMEIQCRVPSYIYLKAQNISL